MPLKQQRDSAKTADTMSATSNSSSSSSSSYSDLTPLDRDPSSFPQLSQQKSCMVVRTQAESLEHEFHTSSNPVAVSFGTVQFREHARRMGDNPGCRSGVSLTLDWEVQDLSPAIDLEDYEASRPSRRDRGELNIPPSVRMQMMRDSGYSRGEIQEFVKLCNVARNQRQRTNETLKLHGAQELLQRGLKGFLNKTARRGSKKQEKQWLQEHRAFDQKRLQQAPVVESKTSLRRKSSTGLFLMAKKELAQETLALPDDYQPEDDSVEEDEDFNDSQASDVGLDLDANSLSSSRHSSAELSVPDVAEDQYVEC